MKQFYFLNVLAIFIVPSLCRAQVSVQNSDHTFEMGGDIMAGYNYRFYQSTETDFSKNNFLLDEARFYFAGRVSNEVEYKIRMDLADLAADVQSPSPAIGFLKEAYLIYKTPYVNIKPGYEKVPFSLNSLVDEIDDPFLSRPIVITKVNSRRDLGVTLSHAFPILGLTVYGGLYSGMGEEVFSTPNTNGKPEYVGRIEYAYPGKYMKEMIDFRTAPVPVFQFGASMRSMENTFTTLDKYDLITVNGKKSAYEVDASVFYKGFSAQFETQYLHVIPVDSTRLYSEGQQYSYFNAGGYYVELNYYSKCLKSLFAVRYDQLDPSDLVYGNTQRTESFAYNYFIKQNYLCIKAMYEHHLTTPYQSVIWKDDELRIEFQVIFN